MDETLAMADVDAAVTKDTGHVFYCYTPNHLFAMHDLVILEEPEYDASKWTVIQPTDDPQRLEKSDAPVAWDLACLHVRYAASLEQAHPEAAAVLGSVKLTTDQVSDMTFALVVDKADPDEHARQWAKDNATLVDSWMKQAGHRQPTFGMEAMVRETGGPRGIARFSSEGGGSSSDGREPAAAVAGSDPRRSRGRASATDPRAPPFRIPSSRRLPRLRLVPAQRLAQAMDATPAQGEHRHVRVEDRATAYKITVPSIPYRGSYRSTPPGCASS